MSDATSTSNDSGFSLAGLRKKNYENRRKADREAANYQGKTSFNQQYWDFAHDLASVVTAQAVIFGPMERLKIVLQVNSLVKYANPTVDRPKNFPDLCNKVTYNQGMFAFYRGTSAFVYKLIVQYSARFVMYENLVGRFGDGDKASPLHVVGAATGSALFTTLVSYPLDLAHGRMSADMSKKPALIKDASAYTSGKGNKKTLTMQQQTKSDRLYESVLDCLQDARKRKGVHGPYAGLPIALIAQVPYTTILMSSFEFTNRLVEDKTLQFNRYDDYNFGYKFLQRFGASTLSVTLATAICYPLDTLKRMYQL